MWTICKKELRQFFSSLTGPLAIVLFLLLSGLFLFVFPDTSLFEYGYASLDDFFRLSPWILMFLIPAVTMRTFSEEFRSGTWETLRTRPLRIREIVLGKYLAALLIALLSILPTLVYVFTASRLSSGGIDGGGIAGSYIGLFLLAAVFTAVGVSCSSLTSNPVVSFLLAASVCFTLHTAFDAVAGIPALSGRIGYFVEMLGIESHYRSVSRGVVDSRDLFYFLSVILFFLYLTAARLSKTH
jgi:ABC-2 type transport system permease protein